MSLWLACQGGCDGNHVVNGNRKFKLSLSHHGNIQREQKSLQTDKHHFGLWICRMDLYTGHTERLCTHTRSHKLKYIQGDLRE